jgi:hypothetical protein
MLHSLVLLAKSGAWHAGTNVLRPRILPPSPKYIGAVRPQMAISPKWTSSKQGRLGIRDVKEARGLGLYWRHGLALMMTAGEHGQDRTRPFGTTTARLQRVVVCSESQARAIEDVTAVNCQVSAVEQQMLRAALFTHSWCN